MSATSANMRIRLSDERKSEILRTTLPRNNRLPEQEIA